MQQGKYLDSLKVEYRLSEYEVDESDLSAESVARKVSLPLEQVFKTIVVRGDKTGVLLACIPGGVPGVALYLLFWIIIPGA